MHRTGCGTTVQGKAVTGSEPGLGMFARAAGVDEGIQHVGPRQRLSAQDVCDRAARKDPPLPFGAFFELAVRQS